LQTREIAAIVGAKGVAIVAWSVDHVKEMIAEFDRTTNYGHLGKAVMGRL